MDFSGNKFQQRNPHVLELKKGGGCLGCFGIPFFAAGIFMFLIFIQIVPMSNGSDVPWWGWIILGAMSLIFTAVGGSLVFGRNWITLDTMQRRIWVAWGLLKPMRGTVYDLDNYRTILLKFIRGDSDTADSYQVSLATPTGGELDLISNTDYAAALAQAELLMGFLNLPLEDSSTDHTQIVKQGIRNIIETPGSEAPADNTTIPEKLLSTISAFQDGIRIGVPGPAFRPFSLLGLLFPLVLLIVFGQRFVYFLTHSNTPVGVQYTFFAFFGFMFVLIPLSGVLNRYLASKRVMATLTVNAEGITLAGKGYRGKKGIKLGRDRIIALDFGTADMHLNKQATVTPPTGNTPTVEIPAWVYKLQRFIPSRGVIIKSKDGLFTFGAGLPAEEVKYIYSLVEEYLRLKQ